MSMYTVFVVVAIQLVSLFNVTSASYDFYYDQKPLLLTPYLKAGNAAQAQKLSQTNIGGRISYSGYLTTDEKCGNNLFIWFFPAEINSNSAPSLLWMNGGPGVSSTYGLLAEVGPWREFYYSGFKKNIYTWTRDYNVLFIDQPVGTGFSYSEKGCYPKTMAEVIDNLYSALSQFFKMFQNLQKNALYLTGHALAAQYSLDLAVKIDNANQVASNPKINLVGIIIGNPNLDYTCNDNSEYLYQLGIVDDKQRQAIKETHDEINKAIKANNYSAAANVPTYSFDIDIPNDFNIYYNGIDDAPVYFKWSIFLRDIQTRNSIHVGYTPFYSYSNTVYRNLNTEVYKTERPNIEYLLKTGKYILAFYSGQLDADVTVASVTCALSSLQWAGSQEYLNATRTEWNVAGRLAGWFKTTGNLLEVVVRDAGRFVPWDAPDVALGLLRSVVSSKPGNLQLVDLGDVLKPTL